MAIVEAKDYSEGAIQARLIARFGIEGNRALGWYDRELDEYLFFLFRDDPERAQYKTIGSDTSYDPYPFYKYKFRKGRSSIHIDVGKKPIFDGINGFFAPDSRILDLGSGGGTAVKQINERYGEQGVMAFGVDIKYALQRERPLGITYSAGSWTQLPFASNTFTRLFGFESFSAHLQSGLEWRGMNLEQYGEVFREITRVAKEGCIWRGTYSTNLNSLRRRKQISSAETLSEIMTGLGWEVYHSPRYSPTGPGTFVAQLRREL